MARGDTVTNFARCIGGMRLIPQWFMWRLELDAIEGKYLKTPCPLNGAPAAIDAGLPSSWHTYEAVAAAVAALDVAGRPTRYAMGFRLTPGCGYFLLDIDKCITDGALSAIAAKLVAAFPGAMMEYSSSLRGVHVLGRYAGVVEHRSMCKLHNMEFYTQDRGIAFGLDDACQGSADTMFDVQWLVDEYFPPRSSIDEGVAPEYRGPFDDEVLITKMLGSSSAIAKMSGKASVQQLWAGEVPQSSEADMALASHLAFWTGRDQVRMERLMRRSGLVRDKWNTRRPGGTYLTYTIGNVCAGGGDVYVEPQRSMAAVDAAYMVLPQVEGSLVTTVYAAPVAGQRVSPEVFENIEALIGEISACGTELDMVNDIMPKVHAAGVPSAFQSKVVNAWMKKMKLWGNTQRIADVRLQLFPPVEVKSGDIAMPDWAANYCYVLESDYFLNVANGARMTMTGFQAQFNRLMPLSEQGRRGNAAEYALNLWGMPTVERVGYKPDEDVYYEWDSVRYANLYSPSSVPECMPLTEAGVRGIEAFKALLWDMCGRREAVFLQMLYWFAHNVQFPGRKIRWAPLLKGINGDGKTLLFTVLRAAMGYRNVKVTGNSVLTASGGFNDWSTGAAVNIIEEIYLTGKIRYQLYNATKEMITNDVLSINAKGRLAYMTPNYTNHAAATNHNNGVPLEPSDRRWFVIFTPWSDMASMLAYCGLDAAGWKDRTGSVDHAWRHCAGELRAWFLSLPIPAEFDINGTAMLTPEKRRMMASSVDDIESLAETVIAEGGYGVTNTVISSGCFSKLLTMRALQDGIEVPKTAAWSHMLGRLGFSKIEKYLKWDRATHIIWVKDGTNEDNHAIRLELDKSRPAANSTPNLP